MVQYAFMYSQDMKQFSGNYFVLFLDNMLPLDILSFLSFFVNVEFKTGSCVFCEEIMYD